MKEPLIFISVSVEKELPKEDGLYVFGGTAKLSIGENELSLKEYMDVVNFKTEKKQDSSYFDIYEYFLKPISLPELMEEFDTWKEQEYKKAEKDWYIHKSEVFTVDFKNTKRFTFKDVFNDFLTQKGIL